MNKSLALAALGVALVGLMACAKPPSAAPTLPATTAPLSRPTGPDHKALADSLQKPLSALIGAEWNVKRRYTNEPLADIIATRDAALARFNAEGDKVLAAIDKDLSVPANRLHSVVINTRAAVEMGDQEYLEAQMGHLSAVTRPDCAPPRPQGTYPFCF